MFVFETKLKIFFYVTILSLFIISCKTTESSKKINHSNNDSSSSAGSSSSDYDNDSDSDSSSDSSGSSSSSDFTEESYDSTDPLGVKLITCRGMYKLNTDCDESWTRKILGCYMDVISTKDDNFHQAVYEYYSQGYTRVVCYTSGSSYAISLFKHDSEGTHQKILIQEQ